jgi:hypothetical protein
MLKKCNTRVSWLEKKWSDVIRMKDWSYDGIVVMNTWTIKQIDCTFLQALMVPGRVMAPHTCLYMYEDWKIK